MEAYLENAPCLFLLFDVEGRLLGVNNTLCQTTGYAREELLQKTVDKIATLGTRIFFQTHLFPMLRLQGKAEEIFITLCTQSGAHVPVMLNVQQNGDGTFTGIGITIVNRNKYESEIIAAKKKAEQALAENRELITAKKELEEHTAQLDAQLTLLRQQNEDSQQLNFTLAHTLQEPLRKMALFSSKLFKEGIAEDEQKELLQKIRYLGVQTRELLMQLQRFVQMGLSQKPRSFFSLQKILTHAAAQVQKKGHVVALQTGDLPLIEGFAGDVEEVFLHLFDNAVKFRKPGSVANLTVTATVVQANTFRTLKEKYRYRTYLKVSVADEGIGFSEAAAERIFGIFVRLSAGTPGYGMGLAFCRKIMELHNGFITAESRGEKGAVLNCYFPLMELRIAPVALP